MTAEELNAFFAEAFPYGRAANIEHADGKTVRARFTTNESQLRPGGTISGPTMMGLADTVMYALVLSAIGKVPLAVTHQPLDQLPPQAPARGPHRRRPHAQARQGPRRRRHSRPLRATM